MTSGSALERWRETLEARAIPQAILDAAPASPWGFRQDLFRRRAERASVRVTPTSERALEALPEGGTVLDVGCGGGATSIRPAERASEVTGVDRSPEMLATFREAIGRTGARARTVEGAWPDVAGGVPGADVVVCGHVLYNVPRLGPFVEALTQHARSRVVVEITERHPLAWMNDLWQRFHGVRFPDGPSADDAVAAIEESGIDARRDDHVDDHAGAAGFASAAEVVALVRTRLCLTPEADGEIAEALGGRLREGEGGWSAGPPTQPLATMWWPGGG